jgi:hypothetical protein
VTVNNNYLTYSLTNKITYQNGNPHNSYYPLNINAFCNGSIVIIEIEIINHVDLNSKGLIFMQYCYQNE